MVRYETADKTHAVEIAEIEGWDILTTYTRGTKEPLYIGRSETAARESLGMSEEDFTDLFLRAPV